MIASAVIVELETFGLKDCRIPLVWNLEVVRFRDFELTTAGGGGNEGTEVVSGDNVVKVGGDIPAD